MKLRNSSDITVEEFKRELDRYLTSIPDEPLIPGYTAMRRTDSNSLLDAYGLFHTVIFSSSFVLYWNGHLYYVMLYSNMDNSTCY